MKTRTKHWIQGLTMVVLSLMLATSAQAEKSCLTLRLSGEAVAGKTWHAGIGEDWEIRLVPIAESYSGWDITVDRAGQGSYPDAVLLATPPYNSLSEREIGTTWGLRAQDALNWNPRSFRFFTSAKDLASARQSFAALGTPAMQQSAQSQLLALTPQASSGQLRILDGHVIPGVADPAPFARRWAESHATPYTVDASHVLGQATNSRGQIHSLRFEFTLWLPAGWHAAPGLTAMRTPCP